MDRCCVHLFSPMREVHFVQSPSPHQHLGGSWKPPEHQSSPADVNLTHVQQLLIVGPVLVPIASTGINTFFVLDIFIQKSEYGEEKKNKEDFFVFLNHSATDTLYIL